MITIQKKKCHFQQVIKKSSVCVCVHLLQYCSQPPGVTDGRICHTWWGGGGRRRVSCYNVKWTTYLRRSHQGDREGGGADKNKIEMCVLYVHACVFVYVQVYNACMCVCLYVYVCE